MILTDDDPRHGTDAGYRAHYRYGPIPACRGCLDAHNQANKRRRRVRPKVPSLGSRRRVTALRALGYSLDVQAAELGYRQSSGNGCGQAMLYLWKSETMSARKALAIAKMYERLCMTVPVGPGATRTRTWAARRGDPPPLAWTNIDDPNEVPSVGAEKPPWARWLEDEVDEVVVERILAGDFKVPANRAERLAVFERWDGPVNRLDKLTGWNIRRDLRKAQEAVA